MENASHKTKLMELQEEMKKLQQLIHQYLAKIKHQEECEEDGHHENEGEMERETLMGEVGSSSREVEDSGHKDEDQREERGGFLADEEGDVQPRGGGGGEDGGQASVLQGMVEDEGERGVQPKKKKMRIDHVLKDLGDALSVKNIHGHNKRSTDEEYRRFQLRIVFSLYNLSAEDMKNVTKLIVLLEKNLKRLS